MKKFLHGRRHLRARRSVQAGREKRFIRKFNQNLKLINRIDWTGMAETLAETLANAVQCMIDAAVAMAPKLQAEVRRMNSSFALKPGSSPEEIKEILRGLS